MDLELGLPIDALMFKFYGKKFDRDGRVAKKGRAVPGLLKTLMRHAYFGKRPPKSTGREMFGSMILSQILSSSGKIRREDLVATATQWTALSVYDQYRRFVSGKMKADEMLVSGGGARNSAIVGALQNYFGTVPVRPIESIGFSSAAKEAVCFAVLANETISGNPSNVPRATGAIKPVVLGKICL